jgi:hypothetical protein
MERLDIFEPEIAELEERLEKLELSPQEKFELRKQGNALP